MMLPVTESVYFDSQKVARHIARVQICSIQYTMNIQGGPKKLTCTP